MTRSDSNQDATKGETMLTVDARCTDKGCVNKNMYRMVGRCANCGTEPVLVLFSHEHETRHVECPVCGNNTVQHFRLATEDEFPEATRV